MDLGWWGCTDIITSPPEVNCAMKRNWILNLHLNNLLSTYILLLVFLHTRVLDPVSLFLQHHSQAPKIGNGGTEESVPNTAHLDSIERSPLHPQSQARVGRKGSAVSSPSLNRKGTFESSHGIESSTPGRSRLRSVTRGDETVMSFSLISHHTHYAMGTKKSW